MPQEPLARITSQDPDRLRRLDSLCDQFESQWQAGAVPALDSFLAQVPPEDQQALLEELLPLDIAYRRQRGEELTTHGYAQVCPQFASLVSEFMRGRVARGETTGHSDTEPIVPVARPSLQGQQLGDYDLIEEIGRGGMGVVYKAHQRSLDRVVAIKTILSGPQATSQSIERFVSEAQLAATLHHPGIVPIYEIGEREGLHYFSMEYVKGQSLHEYVNSEQSSPTRIAELVGQIAEIVHFAHERGVLHRDLKPSNVIVGEGGRVRVMDFGLAKRMESSGQRTQAGEVLGTPSYMSPEQARSDWERVDRRSDVYSLGAILYSLLTSRPPHEGASPILTIVSVLHESPVPPSDLRPDLDEKLEQICLRCLAKDPDVRYATVDELQRELETYVQSPTAPVRSKIRGKNRRWLATAILGCGVAILLVAWAIILVFADPDAVDVPESPPPSVPPFVTETPKAPPLPPPIVLPLSREERHPGDLDASFGRQGLVRLPLGTAEGINDAYTAALQPDGKIVVAGQVTRVRGSYYMAVTRFHPNGKLDTSFTGTGKLLLWFGPFDDGITGRSLVIQPDGCIVIGGRAEVRSVGYDFGLARLRPDGELDETFGRRGLVTLNINNGTSDLQAMVLQPDGKLVAAGTTHLGEGNQLFSIARFLTNGSLDREFGKDGKAFIDFPGTLEEVTDLDIREDGRIVVVGRAAGQGVKDVAVMRLLPDGQPDSELNETGSLLLHFGEHDSANHLVLQGEKAVLQVESEPRRLVRLLNDGSIDDQFGEQAGSTILDFPSIGLVSDPEGNLIVAHPRFARLVLFTKDGKLLANYGLPNEEVLSTKLTLREMVRAPDGKLVLPGTVVKDENSSDWAVVRIQGPPAKVD
ncbi:MAG: protein kinase [Pirellulales bacterium]